MLSRSRRDRESFCPFALRIEPGISLEAVSRKSRVSFCKALQWYTQVAGIAIDRSWSTHHKSSRRSLVLLQPLYLTIMASKHFLRVLPARTTRSRSYHFDTHQLVSRLEREGLSPQQSIGIMSALEDVVKESMSSLVANLVTRSEQEKVR